MARETGSAEASAAEAYEINVMGTINLVASLQRTPSVRKLVLMSSLHVYGGDFLQHQPPVKEMTEWGPRIIDLMDRLGVPFNRTSEGFRDQRRFGGTMFKRTAFAGATCASTGSGKAPPFG